MKPDYTSPCGTVTMYRGDCLAVLPTLEARSVDAVLTDLPYGLNVAYASYDDTQENLRELVANVVPEMRRVAVVVALTCGVINMHTYPRPDWTLCWACSGAGARGKWGFNCWQPVIVYGVDPYLRRCRGARPDLVYINSPAEDIDHPCPKPLKVWAKILDRISPDDSDAILDPFMGSGTTAVACIQTGRRFIGVELEPRYFDIAVKRVEKALADKSEQLVYGPQPPTPRLCVAGTKGACP